MKSMLISFIFIVSSCNLLQSNNLISFTNNSKKHIDSLIIVANNYTIKLYNIAPHGEQKISIESGAIMGNHHIEMNPTFYVQDSIFKAEHFYSDLGGFSGEYKLSLEKDMTARWRWRQY